MSLSRGDFPSSCMNQHSGKQMEEGRKRLAKGADGQNAKDTPQEIDICILKGQTAKWSVTVLEKGAGKQGGGQEGAEPQ